MYQNAFVRNASAAVKCTREIVSSRGSHLLEFLRRDAVDVFADVGGAMVDHLRQRQADDDYDHAGDERRLPPAELGQ